MSFAAMLHPLPTEDFFGEHWQNRPLVQCAPDRHRFDEFVCIDDVEQLATIALSLANANAAVLASRCVEGRADYWELPRGVAPTVAVHSLLHAFDAGYSIVINAVDRIWGPLGRMARAIEAVVQHPVGATLYYSPASVQAFPAHFDQEDIIAVQVAGQKVWDLCPPEPQAWLGNADPYQVPASLDRPTMQADLCGGDLLYLPRGWSHRVWSQEQASLHVTFAIRSLRWADLVLRAAQHAIAADVSLQQSLPLHHDISPAELNAMAATMLAGLTMTAGYDAHRELMAEVLRTRPPSLSGQSRSLLATTGLTDRTVLRRRDGLTPLVDVSAAEAHGEVTILFAGNGVAAPARFVAALEFVAATSEFTTAELAAAAREDCTALAEALITNGLLVIDEP